MKSAVLLPLTLNIGLAAAIVEYRQSRRHPLAAYPGPRLARVTKWWMAYWIGTGNRHLLLARLHKEFGPWVRIGPNELSVHDPLAIRPIYSKMFRAPFYQGAPSVADALITTLSREEHDRRLIAWNKAFSSESLKFFHTFANNRTEQLLDILQRETSSSGDKEVNLSHWVSLWAMDIMGDMSFSGGFETLASGRDTEGWMEILQMGVFFLGILGQVPWTRDVIAMLPQPGPIITFQNFVARKVVETKAKNDGIKQDLLGIIQDEGSGGPTLSDEEAASDAALMVVAGSDTVSHGLTGLFRYIAASEVVQNRLRAEIQTAFQSSGDIDAFTLAKLPYLDACVQEALRIFPPVASGPPRYSGESCIQIFDKFVPPRTTVACPIYSIQRDPQNFGNPLEFIPERWLPGSAIQPHNADAFVPFCYGPGVCIGKPVALYNMKLLVIRLLQSFEMVPAKSFDSVKFDSSWKEYNLWVHDPLVVNLKSISTD
ncbi:cytochrome P450 [Phlegmacium glaucopus]|nr:cytochrome P450 [Phlegmacium glaucopus]